MEQKGTHTDPTHRQQHRGSESERQQRAFLNGRFYGRRWIDSRLIVPGAAAGQLA
jgi:hypothetical protein